ncbi:hypothetical protein [Candidatus Pantoea multigeneris]|nr:hypothetical protein [Pantoea multigeneris]
MIIIHLRFDGGSTEEEHDIAHIASSIVARLARAFFCLLVGLLVRGVSTWRLVELSSISVMVWA